MKDNLKLFAISSVIALLVVIGFVIASEGDDIGPTGVLDTTNTTNNSATNDTTPHVQWNVTSRYNATIGVTMHMNQTNYSSNATVPNATFTNFTNNTAVADGTWWMWLTMNNGSTTNVSALNYTIIVDSTVPTRTLRTPTNGSEALDDAETLEVNVTTNELANCSYSTSSTTDYNSMTAFTTTNAMEHRFTTTAIARGGSLTYYVECRDKALNSNADGWYFTFTRAQTQAGGGGGAGPSVPREPVVEERPMLQVVPEEPVTPEGIGMSIKDSFVTVFESFITGLKTIWESLIFWK